MRKIYSILICMALLLSVIALFAGCSEGSITTADNNGTTIVVTSPAAHALVRPLTQNYVEDGGTSVVTVVPLYKPGQDIHSFEPTAKDIISLASADVVISTGSEGWLEASLKASGNTVARVVSMMEVCDVTADPDHDHHSHEGDTCGLMGSDEHVWLSVENAIDITHAIAEALRQVDGASGAVWTAHQDKACGELRALANEYTDMMTTATKRIVVVADRHPFSYLFRDLGVGCVAAFPGCSSETSASFETQTALIEAVRENGLAYIFVMEGSDAKVAGVVAGETGAEILTLNSLQIVPDYENISYIETMKGNLQNLKKALQ